MSKALGLASKYAPQSQGNQLNKHEFKRLVK